MKLVNAALRLFPRPVGLSNSLARRFGWLAFPGLIRGISVLHFFMFAILVFRPAATRVFAFNWQAILNGELWRLISFFLIPPVQPGPIFNYLFIFFVLFIGFLINDSLESAWGSFRTSLYCYALLACQIIANILINLAQPDAPITWGGQLFYAILFISFSTIHPLHKFLFGIPAFILAILAGLMALGMAVAMPPAAICFIPYLAWALPRFHRWSRTRGETIGRRTAFRSKLQDSGAAFHKCESCGATDKSHPDREFRVLPDDRELCSVCLDEQNSPTLSGQPPA